MVKMGLNFGLEKADTCVKMKNRWLFKIPEVSASGVNSLPPSRSARPSLSFKEIAAEHLTETIYFPGKVDYKPITLNLYDLKKNKHPVLSWLKKLYNACDGTMSLPSDSGFIQDARLELYNGCGDLLETWVYENVWPNNVDFGELDMSSSDIVQCEITLRYARAYIYEEC